MRKMTRKVFWTRCRKYDRWFTKRPECHDLTDKAGCLIQFFQDYGGYYLESGKPDLKDETRWTNEKDGFPPYFRFLPGDIAMFLGWEIDEEGPLGTQWTYRFLFQDVVVSSWKVAPAPHQFFEKAYVEILSDGEQPWDCSELYADEIDFRQKEDDGW